MNQVINLKKFVVKMFQGGRKIFKSRFRYSDHREGFGKLKYGDYAFFESSVIRCSLHPTYGLKGTSCRERNIFDSSIILDANNLRVLLTDVVAIKL